MEKQVFIKAPVKLVWRCLTQLEYCCEWMQEEGMELEIDTQWKPGSPFYMRGIIHGVHFENKGAIITFEPESCLEYTHLSSLSELPDLPENFSHIRFSLDGSSDGTLLTLKLFHFPTLTIRQHLELYWQGTLPLFRSYVEQMDASQHLSANNT